MSMNEPESSFIPEDGGEDDHPVTLKRADIRALEASAKKGKDADAAVARAEAAERALAFAEAGVNTSTPEGQLFMRGYDGELDKEKVREAAIPFGLVASEDAPAKGGGHVLNDDTGDTKLLDGEADLTSQRTTVASGAPPDQGIEVHPMTTAIEIGQRVISEGGKVEEGWAAGFAHLVAAANAGDNRVTIDRRSPAGADQG